MKIKSGFAILDVKSGRAKLRKVMSTVDASRHRIPVTITGFITHEWGSDDGESQEFAVDVTSVEVDG
jgi:hypothetical protein